MILRGGEATNGSIDVEARPVRASARAVPWVRRAGLRRVREHWIARLVAGLVLGVFLACGAAVGLALVSAVAPSYVSRTLSGLTPDGHEMPNHSPSPWDREPCCRERP